MRQEALAELVSETADLAVDGALIGLEEHRVWATLSVFKIAPFQNKRPSVRDASLNALKKVAATL